MSKILFPTIHHNGSSVQSLCEANDAAREALRRAITALEQAAPHERDYYPQGPNTGRLAQAEHRARIDKLVSVQRELEALRGYLAEIEDSRGRAT